MIDQPISIQKVRLRKHRRLVWRHIRNQLKWAFPACGFALIFWAGHSAGLFSSYLPDATKPGARQITAHPNLSRVIDADTIVVDGIHVRLDGISAPERGHDAYTKGKWFVADLMREASMVECDLEGRKSYDREVGACYFVMPDGQRIDPQAEAVKAGFARDCPRYSGGKYRRFETPESRALPLPSYC